MQMEEMLSGEHMKKEETFVSRVKIKNYCIFIFKIM